jgi:GNAT superfamily N-acetyltransferase
VIRSATAADIASIVDLGLTFIGTSAYRDHFVPDRAAITHTVAQLVAGQTGTASVVLVADVDDALIGMLGLFVAAHPFSGLTVAVESFWFVDPASRGSAGARLLTRAIAWARAHDAQALLMIAPHGAARVSELYARLGFVPVETAWQKVLYAPAQSTPAAPPAAVHARRAPASARRRQPA